MDRAGVFLRYPHAFFAGAWTLLVMAPKLSWRRAKIDLSAAVRGEPGSIYEGPATLSRQQRQVETPIYAPTGVFYQVPPVPPVPIPHEHGLEMTEPNNATAPDHDLHDADAAGLEEPFEFDAGDSANVPGRPQKRRQEQWRRWNEELIPEMLVPYISLLRETNSLRDLTVARDRKLCGGCPDGTSLGVSCIYFERIEKVVLCTCKEPALQLLSLGLFPCAPMRPTLAVDLNMLEFARDLFQNMAPNTTAWSETLEGFLGARGYKLKNRDAMRIRFGNALQWYATLQDMKRLQLAEVLDSIRRSIQVPQTDEQTEHYSSVPENSPNVDENVPTGGPAHPKMPENPDNAKKSSNAARPSEYLRQRCPLCFGGNNWHKPKELFDGIVCIDANFTQKRRKSQGNAWSIPRQHPETLFVSPDDVAAMKADVEEVRPTKSKAAASDDAYEPGMKVPSSTLDECHESFTAADANRVKASTQFFADTGLMALLCRHDRVLWLANMTSAGEKQYYALCLLQKLFQHIPATMRIGVLYDIGCQLHRSCLKYDFLEEILDRITFGISVFHAYGHQWPCQIIYHPRKCEGFGLSDGEGCERFWSSIKPLIPSLRVSGYYTRIYAIDTKVKHLDELSLAGMGKWLQRKWKITQEKKTTSSDALAALYQKGLTEQALRQEWADQIQEQTRLLPRQSKNLADKEIHSILALKENAKTYQADVALLEDMIMTDQFGPGITVFEAQSQIQELKAKANNTAKSIEAKTAKLSLSDQQNLKRLLGNDFLRIRMNALAVKHRIRERLRYRKHELESFGSSYRSAMNHQKLQQHAEHQIKRKEPGIQKLARTYNKLCQDLEKLIQKRSAPRGARVPSKISLDGLFTLDVDHDIWQDDDLTNDLDSPHAIPDWLGNDNVRTGIKLLLQHDRCIEEERRLIEERRSMQEWYTEEWNLVDSAIELAENEQDLDLVYQFEQHKNHLLHLCISWKEAVSALPCPLSQNWGPTEDELERAKAYRNTEQVIQRPIAMDDFTDSDFGEGARRSNNFMNLEEGVTPLDDLEEEMIELSDAEFDDHEEAELVDAMEGFDLVEEFRQ